MISNGVISPANRPIRSGSGLTADRCIRLIWVNGQHDQFLVSVCGHDPQVVNSLQHDDVRWTRAWDACHEVLQPPEEPLPEADYSTCLPTACGSCTHACEETALYLVVEVVVIVVPDELR